MEHPKFVIDILEIVRYLTFKLLEDAVNAQMAGYNMPKFIEMHNSYTRLLVYISNLNIKWIRKHAIEYEFFDERVNTKALLNLCDLLEK